MVFALQILGSYKGKDFGEVDRYARYENFHLSCVVRSAMPTLRSLLCDARSETCASRLLLSFHEESPRAVQRIQFADVEQVEIFLRMGLYLHLIANAEVEIHDGKASGQGVHICGYLGIHTMNA